jgi:hypothetical protein
VNPSGKPRVKAVMAAIVGFAHPARRVRQPHTLGRLVGALLDQPYTSLAVRR